MRTWVSHGVVAAMIVLGSGVTAAAEVQRDQIPTEVRAGDRHVVVKSGVVGAPGNSCGLFIGGVRAGSCDAGAPLRGTLEVTPEHPTGQQTLTCRNCWPAKADTKTDEKKALPDAKKKVAPKDKVPEPPPVPPVPPAPPVPPVPPEPPPVPDDPPPVPDDPPPVPDDPLPVMPDLTGFLLTEATQKLAVLGWPGQPDVQFVPVEDVSKIDRVVGQAPAAGTQLAYTDPVMVSIGESPCPTDALGAGLIDFAGSRRQSEVVLGTVTVLPAAIVSPSTTSPPAALIRHAGPQVYRSAATSSSTTPTVTSLLILLVLAAVGVWLYLRTRRAAKTGLLPVVPPPGGLPPDPAGGDVRPVRVFLALASAPDDPLPKDQPLSPDTPHVLAVDIGELTGAGRGTVPLAVVAYDSRTPTLTGEWVQEMSLTGAAPGRVDFPLRTPPEPDRLRWRCGLYCRGVLVQSFVVLADVGPVGGWDADRDFVTSFGLDPAALKEIEPHELSLMINHDTRDQHGLYTYFDSEKVAMTGYVPAAHISKLRCDAERLYRTAGTGRMDRAALAKALGSFALHGFGVLSAITPDIDWAMLERSQDPEELWQKLAGEVRVQVAWPRGHSCPLPANIVYDYPLAEIDSSRLGLCERFFDDLARDERPVCLDGRCVSGSDTVVCPAGFWGYRLLLSCQPSQAAAPVPDRADAPVTSPSVVLGVSTDPRFLRRDQHLAGLQQGLPEVVWHEERARDALLERLCAAQPNLVYLYCHGAVDPTQGIGYLELGPDDRLSARGMHGKVARGAWQSRPLVLLNGCSTAALGDQTPNALIPKLLWAGASGVVGTDVDITEDWACAFADTTVPLLLAQGRPIGEAVRAGRRALLAAGSPLGLTYVAFAPSDLRVIRS